MREVGGMRGGQRGMREGRGIGGLGERGGRVRMREGRE